MSSISDFDKYVQWVANKKREVMDDKGLYINNDEKRDEVMRSFAISNDIVKDKKSEL